MAGGLFCESAFHYLSFQSRRYVVRPPEAAYRSLLSHLVEQIPYCLKQVLLFLQFRLISNDTDMLL